MDSYANDNTPSDQESNADSDIERDLLKRYKDIALSSLKHKDYPRAESFYRKTIEMKEDFKISVADLQDLNILLGFSSALQGNWAEAEALFVSVAFTKGIKNVQAFHGVYASSLSHFSKDNYDMATRLCKRAAGGYRKLLGRSDPQYFEAMAVLAMIYDSQGDSVSSEGCRTFLPSIYNAQVELDAQSFLETIITHDSKDKEAQSQLLSTAAISTVARAATEALPSSQSRTDAQILNFSTRLEPTSNPQQHMTQYPYDTSEPNQPPQLSDPARLIIAIDLGTTQTAVAWALVKNGHVEAGIFNQWPGSSADNPLVVSLISP